ncbi:uncharacterized protein BDV17DRAFT_264547 [Aspergillus undulatus]|uniref:uncharacterized protein n=1 Tax=Aspergillus undulatus TaxID=1810928 RepID=UPI003CCCE84E
MREVWMSENNDLRSVMERLLSFSPALFFFVLLQALFLVVFLLSFLLLLFFFLQMQFWFPTTKVKTVLCSLPCLPI